MNMWFAYNFYFSCTNFLFNKLIVNNFPNVFTVTKCDSLKRKSTSFSITLPINRTLQWFWNWKPKLFQFCCLFITRYKTEQQSMVAVVWFSFSCCTIHFNQDRFWVQTCPIYTFCVMNFSRKDRKGIAQHYSGSVPSHICTSIL